MKHIRQEGLAESYASDAGTRDVLKKMMALCYIPSHWIPIEFRKLETNCTTEKLKKFAMYVKNTWIQDPMFPCNVWSVYNVQTRTNNDLEGWHRELNSMCKRNMPFYQLVTKLHDLSQLVATEVNLVVGGQLSATSRPAYAHANANLFIWWRQYANGELAAGPLLSNCSKMYSPQ